MNIEDRYHLFFALWPNDAERTALAAWQPPLIEVCGGKAMRPDTLHATLVFLGEVAGHRLEALQLVAQETSFTNFKLDFETVHYWGHNHIVYAAPGSVPPQLSVLVNELESKLHQHRFSFERRPYKPHVTLLRHARWSDRDLPPMPVVRWHVDDFVLVRSLCDDLGSRYEVLARFADSELE